MKYPFNVYFTEVDGHKFWIAECKALRGCVGQGETADEAVKELELNEKAWLETAAEVGIPIPDIPIEAIPDYSGKFTVRVSPYVHRCAAENAKKSGISLNQYVNDAIVSYNSVQSTTNYVIEGIKEAVASAGKEIKAILLPDEFKQCAKSTQSYSAVTLPAPNISYALN